jgi:tRNA (guanine37-N1)-methyltransferase
LDGEVAVRKDRRKTLSEVLSRDDIDVCDSYDVVGDIAIVRLKRASEVCGRQTAQGLRSVHGNVKTVLAQTGSVRGSYRLRRLKYVSGENRTCTVHRESGCLFSVDVAGCYFSPRLSYERMRIAKLLAMERCW